MFPWYKRVKEANKMSESQKKILEMLAEGKISVDDAHRLLSAVGAEEGGHGDAGHRNTSHETASGIATKVLSGHKYLRVTVTPPEGGTDDKGNLFHEGNVGRVNVRVPMSLIRAGIKLTSLIPSDALDKANSALREKGINFDVRNIKQEDVEELIDALGDMQIDIEGGKGEKVKVFVE
jgi:hypothetical protein